MNSTQLKLEDTVKQAKGVNPPSGTVDLSFRDIVLHGVCQYSIKKQVVRVTENDRPNAQPIAEQRV